MSETSVTEWGQDDPRRIFLRVLNVAWLLLGLLAVLFLQFVPSPAAGVEAVILPSIIVTSFAVYLLTARGLHQFAAYLFCLSVNFTFFALYVYGHGAVSPNAVALAESRGAILAMSGLSIVFAGAMLNRWAPVVFAALNTLLLHGVIRSYLPEVGLRISLPIFWWILALSIWLFSTFLQRMLDDLRAANTSRRQQMVKLSENAALLDLASDAIVIQDMQGHVRYWNQGAETIYGVPAVSAIGRRFDELVASEYPRPKKEIDEHLQQAGRWRGELDQRTADGREISVQSRWVLRRDASDGPAAILAINTDITERKAQEARLIHLAEHNSITGLPNHALLFDRLSQAMLRAKRNEQLLAFIVVDVDRFKAINGGLGHAVGDNVLRIVAERLQKVVGNDITVSHLAGDTFGIVLEDCGTTDKISATADLLLRQAAEPMDVLGHRLVVTLSIGIALYPSEIQDASALMRGADTAMYAAKEQGRNRFRLYEPTYDQRHLRRAQIESALRHAVEKNELYLLYQPKVDVNSNRVLGVEALLRWHSGEFGELAPGDFIPIAEETGLIVSIGAWVLETACAQVRTWHERGHDGITLAVNVSAGQFADAGLVKSINSILGKTGFSAKRLDLEITESAIMRNVDQTLSLLETLQRMDIRLSIDDFGTGYSSLSFLKRFPVHTLKIDQSFIRDLANSPGDASIVIAIVSLAKSLGLSVVAEGVETEEQLNFLRTLQCDEYQGFLFSKPVRGADIVDLLDKRSEIQLSQ